MQILKPYTDEDGWWTYDNQLSTEDWVEVLKTMQNENPHWVLYLQQFYQQPEHTSVCGKIDTLLNKKSGSTSSVVMHIGRYASLKKGDFQIEGTRGEEQKYWMIPMIGRDTKDGFEYCMRPELAEAMEKLGMTDVFETECVRFKYLLEYFVSHLEYVENEDKNHVGYEEYIKPIAHFAKEGTGWRGEHIPLQKQVARWDKYKCGRICININNHYGKGYYTRRCYLNWEATGINVNARWNDADHVDALRLEYYYEENKVKKYDPIEKAHSLTKLGLFDEQMPNQDLKDFYRKYRDAYLEECKNYQNRMEMNKIAPYIQLLESKKNLILQGAPGTGKTYSTAILALAALNVKNVDFSDRKSVMEEYQRLTDKKRIFFTTFHQSMDYEDFIEGLKPKMAKNEDGKSTGQITYEVEDGIFKRACAAAKEEYGSTENKPVVLIIDEINRGNISKIFGELITLLEKDKREGEVNAITVTLPYSKEPFSVPSNLYIIGTMNTTDRSTGSVDYAIRRRFAFVTLKANSKLIEEKYPASLPLFEAVQKYVMKHTTETLDMEDLMIGHSYFMTEDLEMAWQYEIRPLLTEYYKDGLLKSAPHEDSYSDFISHQQA